MVTDNKDRKTSAMLFEEFNICLATYLGKTQREVAPVARELYVLIRSGCRRALSISIDRGVLPAHEAKSIARHNVLMDELRTIEVNLEFLKKAHELDINTIADFERNYRAQVGDRYRQITVPHFDRAPRINIDKIFVAPNLAKMGRYWVDASENLSLDNFLIRVYRSVVTGDPGGGKTTLAHMLCYQMSQTYEKRIVANRSLTPVLIVLREYCARKEKDGSSIVAFMSSEVASKYQLPFKRPSDAFEYLLYNGHLLVIFDGLDELLDPRQRREIVRDIESFCNLYPSTPVLVTSRVVGYEKAPLDPSVFEVFRIAPFEEVMVQDYAGKWFAYDPDLTSDEAERRARFFVEESQIVPDLRSNPLMLALMCNLYRGAGYIPRNRPEVYRKCAEMLFERWDPGRGIYWGSLPISEPRLLLGHLAYWIFSEGERQSGVLEDELVRECVSFLCPNRFESPEEAEKASREFLEFCRDRAWVFTNVGTSAEGERLFKFTHKTFLEYFTAAYLVRKNNTPAKLWKQLEGKIGEAPWDVVAELSMQMIHEQVDGASDELLSELLLNAKRFKYDRWSYLWFGARCLNFLFPSPHIIRELTLSCFNFIIEGIVGLPVSKAAPLQESMSLEREKAMVSVLLLSPPESRSIVAEAFKSSVVLYVNNQDVRIALRAVDLAFTLPFPVSGTEVELYWEDLANTIAEATKETVQTLARKQYLAFLLWSFRTQLSMERLLKSYSYNHLFARHRSLIYRNTFHTSISEWIVHGLFVNGPEDTQVADKVRKAAESIAVSLLGAKMPCFRADSDLRVDCDLLVAALANRRPIMETGQRTFAISFKGLAALGVFSLLAVMSECSSKQKELIEILLESNDTLLAAIGRTIQARQKEIVTRDLTEDFEIPSAAINLVQKWMAGQTSFCR
jgi:hypothetical protein